ncbi:cadherin-89D-like [Pseudomyrmex gracilis]|uniref:cadherin-89D-like n=1 Tax=Pseudomyrmex gracilis TaxID=219809 RepID=UPI000994C64C|nr:cadherin-89D-like [Pseudomyrmex gracilis]
MSQQRRIFSLLIPYFWQITVGLLIFIVQCTTGCQFYPVGEYLKFVRVPENLEIRTEILSLEVHPRNRLVIIPVDKEEDAGFFTYKETNTTHISIILAQSLEDLVDTETPRNLLKFRISCDSDASDSVVSCPVIINNIEEHKHFFLIKNRFKLYI